MDDFLGNDHIIGDIAAMNKARLLREDKRWQKRLEAVGNDFGDCFVGSGAEAYRPEFFDCLGSFHLGNKGDERLIQAVVNVTAGKNTSHLRKDRVADGIPMGLIKQSMQAIDSGGFERMHIKNSTSSFLLREGSSKG